MLYLKPANLEDVEKEWKFVAAIPEDEMDLPTAITTFLLKIFKKRISQSNIL